LALLPAVWFAVQFHDLPHLGDFHDDALYVASAKSLAEGEGYRAPSLPDRPWATKYPPLFAAWLSSAWRANPDFPANLGWFLPLVWIWLPALALVSREVFRDLGFSEGWALALSAAVLLNPIACYFASSVMAELMMATLLMFALALAERKLGAMAGAVAALAFLAKSAALPALLTIPMVFGLRKQFRQAAWFAVIAWPAFFGWSWWAAAHRAPGAAGDYYVDYLGFYLANHSLVDLPSLAVKNVPVAIMSAGRLLAFTSQYSGWANYLSTLLGIVSLLSFFRLGGRFTHYHGFLVGFLPMLVFWNFTPHERFLLPVLPLLMAGLAAEIRQIPKMMPWARPAAAALVASIAYLNAGQLFIELPKIAHAQRARRERLTPVYARIAAETPTDARFAAAQDPLLWLHTGRAAVGMHFPTRYFYNDQRERIVEYFGSVPEFMRRNGLTHALVLTDDHSMDLSPEEVKKRAARAVSHPGLRPLFASGPATVLTLPSGNEVTSDGLAAHPPAAHRALR